MGKKVEITCSRFNNKLLLFLWYDANTNLYFYPLYVIIRTLQNNYIIYYDPYQNRNINNLTTNWKKCGT